jgi:hypothetical protein
MHVEQAAMAWATLHRRVHATAAVAFMPTVSIQETNV